MPAAYDRCLQKISRRQGAKGATAICNSVNAGNVKNYRSLQAKAKGNPLGRSK